MNIRHPTRLILLLLGTFVSLCGAVNAQNTSARRANSHQAIPVFDPFIERIQPPPDHLASDLKQYDARLYRFEEYPDSIPKRLWEDEKRSVGPRAGEPMQFLLYVPKQARGSKAPLDSKAEPDGKFPLVMYLHVLREEFFGRPEILQVITNDRCQKDRPCFLYIPKQPKWWSSSHLRRPNWDLARAVRCLNVLIEDFPIDPSRLYVTGLSSGGYGAFQAAAKYPGKFAASLPTACWFRPDWFPDKGVCPIWQTINRHDRGAAKSIEHARRSQQLFARQNQEYRFTAFNKSGHGSWFSTYSDPGIWDWVFAQRLGQTSPHWTSQAVLESNLVPKEVPLEFVADGLVSTPLELAEPFGADGHATVRFQNPDLVPPFDVQVSLGLFPGCVVEYSGDGQSFRGGPYWNTVTQQRVYRIPAKVHAVRIRSRGNEHSAKAQAPIYDLITPARLDEAWLPLAQSITHAGGRLGTSTFGEIQRVLLPRFQEDTDLLQRIGEIKTHEDLILSIQAPVDNTAITRLATLTNVSKLNVALHPQVTSLSTLASMDALKSLGIRGKLDSRQLAGLETCKSLRALQISTDKLDGLSQSAAAIETLWLQLRSETTDQQWAELAKLQNLKELTLVGPAFNSQALQQLLELPSLQSLMLYNTVHVDDEALSHLAELKHLTRLRLDCPANAEWNGITPERILDLAKIPTLKSIFISRKISKMTEEQVIQAKKRFKNVHVVF
jgi:hypothetical protein